MNHCIICSVEMNNHLFCNFCVEKSFFERFTALRKHHFSGKYQTYLNNHKKFYSKSLAKFNKSKSSDDKKYNWRKND